jgi:cytoskeletal protein CcmA (bactofilin family)
MAANVTIIGRGARVRGRIVGTTATDLEVLGFVEGEIAVGGDVTIDSTGIVGANVSGRKLVVRGAVKGDLTGDEAILLEDGARVAGDVKAPRVAIAPGALVRGYVETGQAGGTPARGASRAQTAAAPRPAAHTQPAPTKASSHATAASSAKGAPAPAMRLAGGASTDSRASSPAERGARRPPPPIVPVLKKAKGQIATKKKER